ncbi:P-loop NTPase fold protein [Thalassospira lucentensis]|uniref:P-loop NTPase fold protein n=1 Tax=Thalassospira lucentensis TaxID=168935 RepID=UPI0003B66FDB|nr:P-loop NTPase fold protein [Thalassospira lucentensis]RCK29397.1 hypothetical protein TH1_05500 [Thalassospira lucentensis MCCC 1A00383 = DSM 14000]
MRSGYSQDNENGSLNGMGGGATRFQTVESLYQQQADALRKVLYGIQTIAYESEVKEPTANGSVSDPSLETDPIWRSERLSYDRPHQVFVIDGARGTGKTSLLITLIDLLSSQNMTGQNPDLASFLRVQEDGGDHRNQYDVKKSVWEKWVPQRVGVGRRVERKVALVLPVIFPHDLRDNESPMEAIFAEIQDVLQRERKKVSSGDTDKQRKIEELIKELQNEVAMGWIFNEPNGSSVLSNDAYDYKDYARLYIKSVRQGYKRIEAWRGFVEKLLDVLGYQILVPSFDDTDLGSTLEKGIVETIRHYLTHPRIVTVMATSFSDLVKRIKIEEIENNQKALTALRNNNLDKYHYANLLEERVEQSLEKVFPAVFRTKIGLFSRTNLDEISDPTFTEYCVRHFFYADRNLVHIDEQNTADSREKFSEDKKNADSDSMASQHRLDMTREVLQNLLDEERLSWWLLNAPYNELVRESVRGHLAFRHQVSAREGLDLLKKVPNIACGISQNALPAQLIANLAKYHDLTNHFVQGLGDIGISIATGKLTKLWESSPPAIEVDEGLPSEWGLLHSEAEYATVVDGSDTPTSWYKLIEFWLDLQIAKAKLKCGNDPVISAWLPRAFAKTLTLSNMSQFKRLGVGQCFPNRFIPLNCVYFYQFNVIEPYLGNGAKFEDINAKVIPALGDNGDELQALAAAFRKAVDNFDDFQDANWLPENYEFYVTVFRLFCAREGRRHEKSIFEFMAKFLEFRTRSNFDYYQDIEQYGVWSFLINDIEKALENLNVNGEVNDDDLIVKSLYGGTEKESLNKSGLLKLIDRLSLNLKEMLNLTIRFNDFLDKFLDPMFRMNKSRSFCEVYWTLAVRLGQFGCNYDADLKQVSTEPALVLHHDVHGRLEDLLRLSSDLIGKENLRSFRSKLLFAYSLAPIVEPMFKYGSVGDSSWDNLRKAWQHLHEGLSSFARQMEAVFNTAFSDYDTANEAERSQEAQSAITGVREHISRVEKRYRSCPESVTIDRGSSKGMSVSEIVRWYFPDFEKEELYRILGDVKKTCEKLSELIDLADQQFDEKSENPNAEKWAQIELLERMTGIQGYPMVLLNEEIK